MDPRIAGGIGQRTDGETGHGTGDVIGLATGRGTVQKTGGVIAPETDTADETGRARKTMITDGGTSPRIEYVHARPYPIARASRAAVRPLGRGRHHLNVTDVHVPSLAHVHPLGISVRRSLCLHRKFPSAVSTTLPSRRRNTEVPRQTRKSPTSSPPVRWRKPPTG